MTPTFRTRVPRQKSLITTSKHHQGG